jgi:hypothetical protein
MNQKHIILNVALLVFLWSSTAHAAESKSIELSKTEPEFQRFIQSLKKAAMAKNASLIHAKLASDYYIERDFGGSFDPSASPIKNFSANFPFDNAVLAPEYKDHGWRSFRQAISGKALERKKDGQLCIPHGALDTKPFPNSQMCFRKKAEGWRIQGQINGGD